MQIGWEIMNCDFYFFFIRVAECIHAYICRKKNGLEWVLGWIFSPLWEEAPWDSLSKHQRNKVDQDYQWLLA